ncbi:hypothetical protein [Candidatus Aquarickettsia rohweri]|uniref:hypothetical protein n=1 Tax=Candidatus Aquarickettsia rohweri TaxID=2602574 RepID=UPI0012B55B9F|nr:hypothetical protein [Candidatus Aquarickettsia rohweri]
MSRWGYFSVYVDNFPGLPHSLRSFAMTISLFLTVLNITVLLLSIYMHFILKL